MACYLTEENFRRILRAYLLALVEPMVAPLGPGELFLEKTPDHALYLREIFEFLPRARVIHILRDGRDVVSSLLAAGAGWLSHWAPKDAAGAAGVWVRHVQAVREARSSLLPGQLHEVRYEDLSRAPAEVLRGCTDFLGLEWDSAEIADAVEANRASNARANGGGTPIPLFGEAAKRSGAVVVEPKGFVRKAKPGGWKNDLSLYQQFRIWRIAHQEMEARGYGWRRSKRVTFACLSKGVDLVKRVL